MKLPYLCATVLFCALIFWLSSQSTPPELASSLLAIPGMDKLGHALLYGGLALTVSVGLWRPNTGRPTPGWFWAPIAFAVLYGITDEIHQYYVPLRTFEVLDLLANATGATIAQVATWRYLVRRSRDGLPGTRPTD